ncbi:MAG: MFS transporter [Dongiaceae bacterium]
MTTPPSWIEVLRDGRAGPTLVLTLAVGLHAIDVFVISTVMPGVVADIGGAAFYAWPTMIYMVASIVGAASAAPLRNRLGGRAGFVAGGLVFLAGSGACGASPTMLVLLLGRTAQGFGGGLLLSLSMALVSELFVAALRTRVLALVSGMWGVAALLGPLLGGLFAQLHWWRGAFLVTLPIIAGFTLVAWLTLPARPAGAAGRPRPAQFPWQRLALLSAGVLSVGAASAVAGALPQAALILLALPLVGAAILLDARAANRLFPTAPLSLIQPVGMANWIYILHALTYTSINIFLPLSLQVLHGAPPLVAGYMIAALAVSWTAASFATAGWRGRGEMAAVVGGQALAVIGMGGLTLGIVSLPLWAIGGLAALTGFGIGACNLHLTSRTLRLARRGEESLTAGAIPTMRSIGIAFAAALAGLLANLAGLDRGIAGPSVAAAARLVDGLATLAPLLALLLVLRLRRAGDGTPAAAPAIATPD